MVDQEQSDFYFVFIIGVTCEYLLHILAVIYSLKRKMPSASFNVVENQVPIFLAYSYHIQILYFSACRLWAHVGLESLF